MSLRIKLLFVVGAVGLLWGLHLNNGDRYIVATYENTRVHMPAAEAVHRTPTPAELRQLWSERNKPASR